MSFKLRPFLLSSLLSVLGLVWPATLEAQYNGIVALQTVQATVANNATCTGSQQTFVTNSQALNNLGFKNIGQTSHLATATSNASSFTMEIDGIDNLGNVFRLSDLQVGTPTSAKGGLVITASGYMPNIQIAVTCAAGATFSISYSGSFSPQPPNVAGALLASTDKLPFQAAAANASSSVTFQTPYGNSQGTIIFQFAATGPAASTVTAQCLSNSGSNLQLFTFNLATAAGAQLFTVSASTCPFVTLSYNSGGASATTYSLEYVFTTIGQPSTSATNVNLANVGGAAVALGQTTSGASIPVVIASNQTAVPQNVAQVSGAAVALGQTAMATSFPVVIANNQTAVPSGQLQPATTKNTETTSGTNAAQTVSIAAVGGQRVYLYSVNVRSSAGTCSITVKDGVGGTVIWTSDANFVGSSSRTATWTTPLASSVGNGMDIVIGACGTGNTSTLDVEASQL